MNGNDAYLRCQDLFARYPLAVRLTRLPGDRGDEWSMVLLAPGEKEEFFVLCQDGGAGSPFTLFPWRAQGMTLIRPDGGDLREPFPHVLSDGVPVPRHGSWFGWVHGVSVTALISAYTSYTPRSPVPGWAVLPWADGAREQWPPFTFEKLLGRWFWEYVRSGILRDLDSLIAAAPDTVFWTHAPDVPGAGCCAVARDIVAADGLVLPRGRYVHRQIALSGTAIPPLESLLASPGRIDLSQARLPRGSVETVSEPFNPRLTPGAGTVAGFVERAAAAFAASIPENPADDGFFGPGSVTWRLTADLSAVVAGLRSLIVQALHPLAMAGVEQHSDWRRDPVGRFASTSSYVVTVAYGDTAAAERAARVVRKIHEHVHGTDTVTGKPYRAEDPDLLLWVHAVQVESTLRAARLFGSPVSDADADAFVAEMTAAARLIGMPDGLAPASVAELDAYLAAVQPDLLRTQAASDTAAFLLNPPGMDPEVAQLWGDLREGVLASLPGWAADLHGFERVRITAQRREEIRQVLGVLDALTLGEPGVLEARQRIELRVRQARASRASRG